MSAFLPVRSLIVPALVSSLLMLATLGDVGEEKAHAFAEPKKVARPDSLKATEWRRTRNGWEPIQQWQPYQPQLRPTVASRIHPVVIGALIALLSMGALLMFEDSPPESQVKRAR